jgi:hypothetical protein
MYALGFILWRVEWISGLVSGLVSGLPLLVVLLFPDP